VVQRCSVTLAEGPAQRYALKLNQGSLERIGSKIQPTQKHHPHTIYTRHAKRLWSAEDSAVIKPQSVVLLVIQISGNACKQRVLRHRSDTHIVSLKCHVHFAVQVLSVGLRAREGQPPQRISHRMESSSRIHTYGHTRAARHWWNAPQAVRRQSPTSM
jgi:hypothetical protein